jgi:putative transposase
VCPVCRQYFISPWNQSFGQTLYLGHFMPPLAKTVCSWSTSSSPVLSALRVFLRSRSDTTLEIIALRQQVAVLKRKRPRPHLHLGIAPFGLPSAASGPVAPMSSSLSNLRPWLAGIASFRVYWRWRSRPRGGRPRITKELRDLIRRLAKENSVWGAPRIRAELQKLGFSIAERTVARYLRPLIHRGDPKQNWLAFLQNHRDVIAAFDFFTVPTLTFRILYCFFVIEHERRKILHYNVTQHPTAEWIVQQLREAFPYPCRYRFVIFDRDRKFDAEVVSFLEWPVCSRNGPARRAPGRMEWRSDGSAVVGERSWITSSR